MKKYIFITHQINNMGGAQSYIRSKMISLKNSGWYVDVLFAEGGWSAIPELADCRKRVEEIGHPTYYYTRCERNKILKRLIALTLEDNYDEVIIESTVVDESTWGELLAQELKVKHILYSLQEDNTISNKSFRDYLLFKWKRKELAGITDTSISQMFSDSFGISIPSEKSYKLSASQYSTVEDRAHPMIDLIDKMGKDYVIGSIGRLNKPFVIPTIKSVVNYIKDNPDKRFVLLLIGDSPKEDASRSIIEAECSGITNLTLYITGYLFPIPSKLIQLCDVNISTSGSARVSERQGVPTISIDENDYLPIGVLGYTTDHGLFRVDEEPKPIKEYLDDILFNKKYKKREARLLTKTPDYTSHFEFINNSEQVKEYYDVCKLHWNKAQWTQRVLMPIIGVGGYYRLRSLFKR